MLQAQTERQTETLINEEEGGESFLGIVCIRCRLLQTAALAQDLAKYVELREGCGLISTPPLGVVPAVKAQSL